MQLRCFQCRQTENRCDASSVVASVDSIRFCFIVRPVCKTDILQSADTKRESHTGWMRVSLCMSVLSFIHLCTYSIRSSLCHMPPVVRGHSASREHAVHPTHEWCSSHAAFERGSSAYRDPESSRTKRLDKHDPQTNAQGLIPMTSCKGCLVQRMKTKTFSFTLRDTVMDDVNADHMWHVSRLTGDKMQMTVILVLHQLKWCFIFYTNLRIQLGLRKEYNLHCD